MCNQRSDTKRGSVLGWGEIRSEVDWGKGMSATVDDGD